MQNEMTGLEHFEAAARALECLAGGLYEGKAEDVWRRGLLHALLALAAPAYGRHMPPRAAQAPLQDTLDKNEVRLTTTLMGDGK